MNIMNAKKKYAIALMIAMIALLLWLIWRVFLFSPISSKIPAKPQDTALEFWIAENVEGVDWTGYDTPYGLFGGKAYLEKNYPLGLMDGNIQIPKEHVIYTVTAWPDYSDGGAYITEIEITDPAISIYGLTVHSSFEEFDRVFGGQGYDISIDKNEYWENHRAAKKGTTFSLKSGVFCESAESESVFTISAEVTNREGIVF